MFWNDNHNLTTWNTFGKLEAKHIITKFRCVWSKATRSKAHQVSNKHTLNHRCPTKQDKRPMETLESKKQGQNSNNSYTASPKIAKILTFKGCHEFAPITHIVLINPFTDIMVTGMITFHNLMAELIRLTTASSLPSRLSRTFFSTSRSTSFSVLIRWSNNTM